MALYWCNHPGCQGHDTFSAHCQPTPVQDYPPLHSFIELLETQPVDVLSAQQPADAPASEPSSKVKDYFNFWRE